MMAYYCKARKQGTAVLESLNAAEAKAEMEELDGVLRGILEELEWTDEEDEVLELDMKE